ncbi:MAG: ABC transporter ATP-binding protein [Acidobacteriia bacterium]|nr:ABC transporter ATP-binding protein [Terriglobia bacterium]
MSSTIRTENLSKRFLTVQALRQLNLEIPQGAIYSLVGPNGAGKTTMIKVLMNILQPTQGTAEVLGTDSTKLRGDWFAQIGYVSENQEQPEWMRVDEFFDYLRPFYPSWDRELESALVRQMALPMDRKLRHLSRGMKMKAALASSLAYRPKLIVLDEPFSGLDPLVRDELVESLLERASEATILISSHDLAEIESFSSHVGYMEEGRLKFSEEMSSLTSRFRDVQVTLNAPAGPPPNMPAAWLQPASSGTTFQFIDSQFEQERTRAAIHSAFSNVRDITFTPMSLRAIFVAMAKIGRKAV